MKYWQEVFRYWISYFRAPTMVSDDNGREFNNEHFQDMTQNDDDADNGKFEVEAYSYLSPSE